MGLKITVFRNDHEGRDGTWYSYSTPAASKKENGEWETVWLDVVFVKGVKGTVLENKTRIDCTDCFFGSRSYTANGGVKKIVPQVVVMAFEKVQTEQRQAEPGGYSALSYDEIDF